MNPRDQAEAGDGDPTKTIQLDDTYRIGIARTSESRHSEQTARTRVRLTSTATLPLEDRCRQADSALRSALIEFRTAASAVIDRIRAGESLPKPELDREWKARLEVIRARKLVERLERQRKAFAPRNEPG
jgi:hypothetical protein